jgi:dihydroorotate dehydrogenase
MILKATSKTLMKLILKIIKIFPPEASHKIALFLLKVLYKFKILNFLFPIIKKNNFEYLNLSFKNRLGTAAGLDKNGDYIDSLGALGFGFLEVGTVTPLPQKGNLKPRVFRLFDEQAVINSLGFNNKGVDYLVKNLKKRKYNGIVGVNIGANKTSEAQQRIDDYLICFDRVAEYCDYLTINISSPNTPGLRNLHEDKHIKNLIDSLEQRVIELNFIKPIFVKISPDESLEVIKNTAEYIKNSRLTGLIISNTTTNREMLKNSKYKNFQGGLSGKPLMERSTSLLKKINEEFPELPIIGVGGVMNKLDFDNKLESGASLIQIYTGFIIKGPQIVSDILN